MAAFDTSFYRTPVKSVAEYRAENDAAEARQFGLKQNRISMMLEEDKLRSAHLNRERTNKMMELLGPLYASNKSEEEIISAARAGGYATEAADMEKSYLERKSKRADIQKTATESADKAVGVLRNLSTFVMANPTPQALTFAVQQFAQTTGQDAAPWMQQIQGLQDPEQIRRFAAGFALKADDLLPKPDKMDVGGSVIDRTINPLDGRPTVVGTTAKTVSPDAELSAATQRRGQNMSDARAREANSIQQQAGRTQVTVGADGLTYLVDKGTGQMRPATGPDGKPVMSGPAGESAMQRARSKEQVSMLVKEAMPLIDQATGSVIGRGVDLAGRLVGASNSGAQAAAQLAAIGGALVMAMPRMEGPQSNLDQQLYREMAGQIGDPTVTAAEKRAALQKVVELWGKYEPQPAQPAGPRPGGLPKRNPNVQPGNFDGFTATPVN